MSVRVLELPINPQPSAIDAWLADLPARNTRDCCRILYAGLQVLNAAPPGIKEHFQALEKIRPQVGKLSQQLSPLFLGKPFPLEEKNRKIAKLGAQFHAELASGYQAIADHVTFSEAYTREDQAHVIFRALHAFESFFQYLSLIHECPSSKLWENVNALYRRAESLNLHTVPGLDIASQFVRLQLARLAAPSRLPQGDCGRLFELLERSGQSLTVAEAPDEESESEYWLDLLSTRPPQAVAITPVQGHAVRYFGVRSVLAYISAFCQATTAKAERLDSALATYLQARWGGVVPLAFEQKRRDVLLIEGFDAIHQAVTRLDFKASEWDGLTNLEIVPLSDHSAFVAGNESMLEYGEGRLSCRVQRSETPGFYRLEPSRPSARCHYLIGLNSDSKLIQTGLAHRNLRRGQGAGALVFELLQVESEAVFIRSEGAHPERRRALFGRSVSGEMLTLITSPMRLKNGEPVIVERKGVGEHYRVAKMLEATGEFVQFEVVPASG